MSGLTFGQWVMDKQGCEGPMGELAEDLLCMEDSELFSVDDVAAEIGSWVYDYELHEAFEEAAAQYGGVS